MLFETLWHLWLHACVPWAASQAVLLHMILQVNCLLQWAAEQS